MSALGAFTRLVGGLSFPEAPRWRAEPDAPGGGRLWFSDFFTHAVMSVGLAGDLRHEATVPGSPSGLGWRADGTLLVVSMHDRCLLARPPGGELRVLADLAPWAPGPCNDLIVDAAGHAWVGHFGFDLYAKATPQPARLLRVAPDGQVSAQGVPLRFPNGMAITPDGRTLLVAETMGQRVSAFDLTPDGNLGAHRVWADLPGVYPDGVALAEDGTLWLADARGARLLRVAEGGTVQETLPTGALRSYACALGGADGRTLFACLAPGIGPENGARREAVIALRPR